MISAFFKSLLVSVFLVAMVYLDAAVVAYLRCIFGINGIILQVPLFNEQIAVIEVVREMATLEMLLGGDRYILLY
jgi:hypothetical protein